MKDQATQIHESKQVFNHFQNGLADQRRRIQNLESNAASPTNLYVSRTLVDYNTSNTLATLASKSLPGRSLQQTYLVKIEALLTITNTLGVAENVTWQLLYGGSGITLGPISIPASSVERLVHIEGRLWANNSEQAQKLLARIMIGADSGVYSSALVNTHKLVSLAINSTIDQNVDLLVQHTTYTAKVSTKLLVFTLGSPQVAA